jgi:hypothetical protein
LTAVLRFDGETTVVRSDAVQRSVSEIGPELLDVIAITNRRGAFGKPCQPNQIIMVQRQILRAGLGRDLDAARLRLLHEFCGTRRAEVNNVDPAAGRLSEEDRSVDGLNLDDGRTRVVVSHGVNAAAALHPGQPRLQQSIALGMESEQVRSSFEMLKGGQQLRVIDAREHGVGVAHEGLEPNSTLLDLLIQGGVRLPRADSAPQREVNDSLCTRQFAASPKRCTIRGRRTGLRHLNDGRDAACRRGTATINEALEFLKVWLGDGGIILDKVGVRVNGAWQYHAV